MDTKTFYSIKEAAEQLGVDYKVIYRLVREGELPATRVGWQYRLSQDDLDRYLDAQRAAVGTRTAAPPPAAEAAPSAAAPPAEQPPATDGISRLQARRLEQNLFHRFNHKVRGVDTVRHPVSDRLLVVDDWEPLHGQHEDRETLMQVLNTAFLDRRLLATTPRNTVSRYTVPGDPELIVEMRFMAHLEALCRRERDAEPVDLAELLVAIEGYEKKQQAGDAAFIVGLASPTGWSQEAIDYIQGSGQGDSYHNPGLRIFLLDLHRQVLASSTDQDGLCLHYDERDPVTARFAGLFRLATEVEERAATLERLRGELVGRSGLVLSDFARAAGVSEELALQAAQALAAEGEYGLRDDRDHGWMVVALL